MAQFTPTSLARLLANVDRELLVDALILADLTHVLYPRHLKILEDIEGNWNALYNVWLSGLVAEAATAVESLYTSPNPRFEPSGVLFVDSAVASVLQALDYFSPAGFLATILGVVNRLEDVVVPDHPPHPPFPPHPEIPPLLIPPHPPHPPVGGPINIYDLNQVRAHGARLEDDLTEILEFVGKARRLISAGRPGKAQARLEHIESIVGDGNEGARHEVFNVRSHTERFINDMLGETFSKDIYH